MTDSVNVEQCDREAELADRLDKAREQIEALAHTGRIHTHPNIAVGQLAAEVRLLAQTLAQVAFLAAQAIREPKP